MMSAILDNTLNFKAKVTTNRDIDAYKKLEKISGATAKYSSEYFLDRQKVIEDGLKFAIENDTKIGIVSKRLPNVFSQLTVWDKKTILDSKELIFDTLNKFQDERILNLICLKDGKSYIIGSKDSTLDNIRRLLGREIKDCYVECVDVWLRKEIIKQAYNAII